MADPLGISRRRAALSLVTGIVLFATLALTPPPRPLRIIPRGTGDVAAFQTIVSRIRAGERYYPAYGDELRLRGYPLRSVFNWRTPILLSILARFPDLASHAVIVALGFLLLAATFAQTQHEPVSAIGACLMQAGVVVELAWVGAPVGGELWVGVLVGLSVCMFARQRPRVAIALGILALFLRELAVPYCAACVLVATVQRRWRQVSAWLAGICVYVAYFAWHWGQVRAHQLTTDLAHPSPWLTLEGLRSLVRVADWHSWLRPSPPWVTALVLTLVVLGVIAARTPLQTRVASVAYLAFFMVAGQSFNGYWGLVGWPTWAIALGFGLQCVSDAACTLAGPRHEQRGAASSPH